MKKQFIFGLMIASTSLISTQALATHSAQVLPSHSAEQVASKSFKLINDTSSKVRLHTGSGFVTLNKGSKTSIGCRVGKKVSLAEKGKKKKTLFTIKSDMCGETLDLSDFM